MNACQRIAVYKKTDPEELIRLMALNIDDRQILNPLFTEFHARYARYVVNLVRNNIAFGSAFEENELKSLAHDTLLRAKDSAHKYKPDANADKKEQERRVKAWLGGIADNEYKMWVRHMSYCYERNHTRVKLENISFTPRIMRRSEAPPRQEVKLLVKAVRKLKPHEKDILGTYLNCADEDGKIESYLRDKLSQEWKQLPQNLKKVKKRAIDKIRNSINKQLKIPNYENQSESSDRSVVHRQAKSRLTLRRDDEPGDTGTG